MTLATNRQLTTYATIGGISIPVIGWQCHLTSYGNLCTFEVTTSIQQLKAFDVDIFTMQQNAPKNTLECKIYLTDSAAGTAGLVFSGIVDTVQGTWEDDLIEIAGRDYSAILRDTSATLDTYVNAKVSDVVTGIAQQAGITQIQIQTIGQISGIRASTFQGEQWSFPKNPQPSWKILTELADEVDCVVFMDRMQTLHFVSPGIGGANQTYYWRPTQSNNQQSSNQNPIMKLDIMQQTRLFGNFTLFLHGYDQNGKQTIYKEDNVGQGGRIIHKNRQDLNAQNVESIWQGLADEIQRKNLVVKMVVEGNLDLNVNDRMTIFESESSLPGSNITGDLLGMSGRDLFIVSIIHSFSMPDYGSEEGDGFLTHITCNQFGGSAGGGD